MLVYILCLYLDITEQLTADDEKKTKHLNLQITPTYLRTYNKNKGNKDNINEYIHNKNNSNSN